MIYSLYELSWFFLIYSFLGWCAGVVFIALRRHTFVNTGFLTLPFCPIYGTAGVLFTLFLGELAGQVFFLFLGGALLSAFLIFLTGWLLERFLHRKWWDFSHRRFQFQGHVSIPLLALWGVLAVVCVRVGDPLFARLLALIPLPVGRAVLLAVLGALVLDFFLSLVTMLQLRVQVRRLLELQEDFRNISDNFGNAITRHIQRRVLRAYPNLEGGTAAQKEEDAGPRVFARGCCFSKLVWLFVIAAFLGDVIETFFCRYTMGVWMSRSSVVWGPFSVVWGLGAVMLTALLYRYKDRRDGAIFFAGTVLGGAYEYACSVFTELVFGTIFWDYSHLPFNLGGRINLLYCFFWGIAAVVWLKLIYPRLSGLIERIPVRIGRIGTWALLLFMICNMAVSSLALARYTQRHTDPAAPQNAVTALLDRHFPDERMERVYPNAKLVD